MELSRKGTRGRAARLAVLLMTGTCLTPVTAVQFAFAQAVEPVNATNGAGLRELNIPAQSLASALIAFSRQTHIQIFADQALVAGKNSPDVSGAMALSAALGRLLCWIWPVLSLYQHQQRDNPGPGGSAEYSAPSDGVLLDPIDVRWRCFQC